VVMGAVGLGLWATIFLLSFSQGMVESYVDNAIEDQVSHLQIHSPKFSEDQDIHFFIEKSQDKLAKIKAIAEVEQVTARSLSNGMLSTGRGARGLQIVGIEPTNEALVTHLDKKIVVGDYLTVKSKNPCLVGKKLAKKMGIKKRSKVVITFQNMEGEMVAGSFRVAGLVETNNSRLDDSRVLVRQSDMNKLLGKEGISHEIAIKLKEGKTMTAVQGRLQKEFPSLKVENYRQISPDIQLYETQIKSSVMIFIVVIMLALLFGIVNTMLMSVLERYKELGMLMAVGMNKIRVFVMIFIETVILTLVAALPGLLLGYWTVIHFGTSGIDMSTFAASLKEFGMSHIVYTALDTEVYSQLLVSVVVTAIVASIYPAWKAVSLKPVEAIRKV
ncbi:MAG TPA: ABC transporter permease, partial [Saprospiraceae bacterium]|nr:ABC transporter permease [Saprospiraceae bacterium]